MKPDTAKLLIEKILGNFNKRYEFKGKQYTFDNIIFENVGILGKYLLGKTGEMKFNIPNINIQRNVDNEMRNKIISIDTEKRKELKINKSTLWYQQKKIKERKFIKVYNKTMVRIE